MAHPRFVKRGYRTTQHRSARSFFFPIKTAITADPIWNKRNERFALRFRIAFARCSDMLRENSLTGVGFSHEQPLASSHSTPKRRISSSTIILHFLSNCKSFLLTKFTDSSAEILCHLHKIRHLARPLPLSAKIISKSMKNARVGYNLFTYL